MQSRKKLKTDSVISEKKNDSVEIWLAKLPDEILLKILRLLPALSILALEKCNKRRFSNLTYDRLALMNTVFSNYDIACVKDFSDFFTRPRAVQISELNFSDCKWIGCTLLENCVKKCKNVCTLNVMSCDLTFAAIFRILKKVKLVNLIFTLEVHSVSDREKMMSVTPIANSFSSLKKIHLEHRDTDCPDSVLIVWDSLFCHCSNLQELSLNFVLYYCVDDFEMCEYEIFNSGKPCRYNMLPFLDSLIVICTNGFPSPCPGGNVIRSFVNLICAAKSPEIQWKKFWIDHSLNLTFEFCDEPGTGFDSVECLQLNDYENCAPTDRFLENFPKNSIRILGAHQGTLCESEKIFTVCGENLRLFKMIHCTRCDSSMHSECVNLSGFFSSCCNITELDLHGVHFPFEIKSPCTAISHLKNLKRLRLPSCAVNQVCEDETEACDDDLYGFKTPPRISLGKEGGMEVSDPFRDMVESCKLVTEFYLKGCFWCPCPVPDCCKDVELDCLYLWSNLEFLLLECLPNVHFCRFLKEIALHCQSFKTLYIKSIGNAASQFLPNLCFLLKKSLSFSSLRVDARENNIATKQLWDSISHARNLENICLSVGCRISYSPDVIVNSISKLSKLKSFHFFYFKLSRSRYDPLKALNGYFKSLKNNADSKENCLLRNLDVVIEETNPKFPEVFLLAVHSCYFENVQYSNGIASPKPF